MSKQWYFQIMGTEIGPITSAELKEKVLQGQVEPTTPIRLGLQGKWQPAAQVKGLIAPPSPQPRQPAPVTGARPAGKTTDTPAAKNRTGRPLTASPPQPAPSVPPSSATKEFAENPAGGESSQAHPEHGAERTYHLSGRDYSDEQPADEQDGTGEYDFFEFVAFDQAIGIQLHEALVAYCHAHELTQTEVTQRALAKFLGREDLLSKPVSRETDTAENTEEHGEEIPTETESSLPANPPPS